MCNHNISKNDKVKEKYKNESTLVWASACSFFYLHNTHTVDSVHKAGSVT